MNPEQPQGQGAPVNPNLVLQEYKIRLHEAVDQNVMLTAYTTQLNQQIQDLKKELDSLKESQQEGKER